MVPIWIAKHLQGTLAMWVALWYMQQNPTSLLIPAQPLHAFTPPQENCWLCRRAVMYRLLRKVLVRTTLQTCHFSAFCFIMKYLIFWSLVGVEFGVGWGGGQARRLWNCIAFPIVAPYFFFPVFSVLKDKRRRDREQAVRRKGRERKRNISVLMLINWHADERERKREERINKPLFKSSLTSENVLAPSKSLRRFWDVEASRHSVII